MSVVLLRRGEYVAVVQYDDAAGVFRGRVTNVGAEITFSGSTVTELQVAFRRALAAHHLSTTASGARLEEPGES
jgi:predicted HicB family RNase H-like nuclease